jgi:hypothetical protein
MDNIIHLMKYFIRVILWRVTPLIPLLTPNVTCYATKDAVRIGNPFYYKLLARNYNYSQLFPMLCYLYTAYKHLYGRS